MSTLSLFSPLDVAITDPGEVDAIGGKVEFHPTRERAIVEALIVGMRDAGHEPLPWLVIGVAGRRQFREVPLDRRAPLLWCHP